MNIQRLKQGALLLSFLVVIFFIAHDTARSQVPPSVKGGPGPAAPKGGAQPKAPPSAQGPKVGKPQTTTDLDEARKRIRKKKEQQEKDDSNQQNPPPVPTVPTALNAWFEPLEKGILKVVSTTWKVEAKKGEKPFTVFTVQLANLSDSYLSVLDLAIHAKKVLPVDKRDPRKIPNFPITVARFCGNNLLAEPIPPRSRQTLTFTYPFAVQRPSGLKATVRKYVKFTVPKRFDLVPVRVVRWNTGVTRTGGKEHMGLFITVENRASYAVSARLKVSLDEMTSAGGETFFFSKISLRGQERKTVILRTVPDEGAPMNDPMRKSMPQSFIIKTVEVEDVQY